MADDFQELYTDLLDYAHRPLEESGGAAKREINIAQLWLNRRYQFKFAEKLVRFTYPANAITVSLPDECAVEILGIISAQLTTEDSAFGNPIDVIEYSKLMQERLDYKNRQEVPREGYETFVTWNQAHEQFIAGTFEYQMFLLGDSAGLYPTPTSDVKVILHINERQAPLVADTDKNFLTIYCKDVIITKALHRFSMYLKEDIRNRPTREQFEEDYQSAVNWDSSIRHSGPVIIN